MSNVKRVLVTGSNGNVGVACYYTFTDANWDVVRWSKRGGECVYAVDLTEWHQVDKYTQKLEPVDMVIMAHGVQKPNMLIDLNEPTWRYVIDGNLTSSAILLSNLIKYNKLNVDSLIVACSSIQANTPRAGRGVYAAAKAGLEALVKTAAMEMAPRTRVVALRLGQLTETMGGIRFSREEEVKLQQRALLPWVTPDDVAQFCLDLYSQKSLTGAVIDLDSGQGRNCW